MKEPYQSVKGAYSFDNVVPFSAAETAAGRETFVNGDAVKRSKMITGDSDAAGLADRFHSGQDCWPDEPARTVTLEFDGLDELPCPADA
ncbi:MAG: hypothetical protein J6Z30_00830, partial [Pyramidobacter sp.]|nr:hypothetical protein [Pyramidobacter sp.]